MTERTGGEEAVWAVGGHTDETLALSDGLVVAAIRLSVLALRLDRQGGRTSSGRRLSHVAMSSILADALRVRASDLVSAVVAQDNFRSQRVCEAHGLASITKFDARYLRMTGRIDAGLGT